MTLDFVVTRKSTETATMFLSIDHCLLKFAYICSSQLYRLPVMLQSALLRLSLK